MSGIMFENFREKLHIVQQDFTTGFKTLGDKSRNTKMKRRPRFEEHLPQFSAGLEILNRYEDGWFLLHKKTKDCAQAAEDRCIVHIIAATAAVHLSISRFLLTSLVNETPRYLNFKWQQLLKEVLEILTHSPQYRCHQTEVSFSDSTLSTKFYDLLQRAPQLSQIFLTDTAVKKNIQALDGDIVMLSAHWERKRTALTQLHEQLQSLPAFINDLDVITANIAHLEGDFEEMESRLVYLETLCFQCEQQAVKQQHISQLETLKKKKRREVELLEEELNSEHAQKVAEMEQIMQQKLREQQKVYEEAFNQDVEQYLSTGYLQHREPPGADICSLDQMTVTNISDQEALDDFLNSSGDEINTGSSLTSGPDLTSCSSESLNQTPPTNNQLHNKGAFWQAEEELASQESDEPLVQLDEEDVQPDMALVVLHDVGTVRGSDDSDSSGDLHTSNCGPETA